jgi:hypothetical protein
MSLPLVMTKGCKRSKLMTTIVPSWRGHGHHRTNDRRSCGPSADSPAIQKQLPALMQSSEGMAFQLFAIDPPTFRIRLRADSTDRAEATAEALDGILTLGTLDARMNPWLTTLLGSVTVLQTDRHVDLFGAIGQQDLTKTLDWIDRR